MKKILNYLLLLAIAASVASCSGSKHVDPPIPPTPPAPPPKPPVSSDTAYMKVIGPSTYTLPVNQDGVIGKFEVKVLDLTPWSSLTGIPQAVYPIINEYYWIQDSSGKTLKEGAFPVDKIHADLSDWTPPYKGKFIIVFGAKGTKVGAQVQCGPAVNFRRKDGKEQQGPGCNGTTVTFK